MKKSVILPIFFLLIMILGTACARPPEFPSETTVMPPNHPFKSAEAKTEYLTLYEKRAQEWPVVSETRMVDTSYGQTFVRISGPVGAPPLVLLPGAAANSLMWAPNIEALSENYRTYAVDNIYDYGGSVFTRTVETPDDFVNWLDELFNALELGNNINLVGHSYGGWISSQYTLRFPERIDKIVLLAPAATVLPLDSKFLARAVLGIVPIRYFTKNMMFWLFRDLVQKDEAGRLMVEEMVDDSFVARRTFKPKRLVSPTVLENGELLTLKTPTLYLVGENEKIYSAEKALQRLNSVAPHIKTALIPNAGHDLTFVQAEMVNDMVVEFLLQQ